MVSVLAMLNQAVTKEVTNAMSGTITGLLLASSNQKEMGLQAQLCTSYTTSSGY